MTEESTFATRLKEIRRHLKISQKALANEMGISNASLSEIESGKYKPGHDFLVNIITKFNVNIYFLLFGDGEVFRRDLGSLSDSPKLADMKSDTLKRFIYYFEGSSIVKYNVLSTFTERMLENPAAIRREIIAADTGVPPKPDNA